jgi:hypothetical protein
MPSFGSSSKDSVCRIRATPARSIAGHTKAAPRSPNCTKVVEDMLLRSPPRGCQRAKAVGRAADTHVATREDSQRHLGGRRGERNLANSVAVTGGQPPATLIGNDGCAGATRAGSARPRCRRHHRPRMVHSHKTGERH